VTIDDAAPSLKSGSGGSMTAALGFTNLTDGDLTLAVAAPATAGANCKPRLDAANIPKAQHQAVTVTIPPQCKVDDKQGITFTMTASGAATPVSFDVTAAPKPADKPNWDALWAFVIALAALVVAAGLAWLFGTRGELKFLEATWSLKDSWASNVTIAAGLLTGIFGSSEVVKALLGDDVDRSIALATVGAAVAAAFIGAGPLLLLATKTREGSVRIGGLLFASALTLTGAYGELWTVYASGHQLDLGGWEDWLFLPAIAAGLLLMAYTITSLRETIHRGQTRPKTKPSETIRAAQMIVRALAAGASVDQQHVEAMVSDLDSQYAAASGETSPDGDYPRRRAAVL
jgi:hypothetical protein